MRRIKALRQARNWPQTQLADEMTAAGVPWTREVVENLEYARRAAITLDELTALTRVFACSAADLVPELGVTAGSVKVSAPVRRAILRAVSDALAES